MKHLSVAENYEMIKTILEVSILLFFGASTLFGAMVERNSWEYLEKYLNRGLDRDAFKCGVYNGKTYICRAQNFKESNGTTSLDIEAVTLFFDKKRVEPILDEAVAHTYFKSVETAEMIESRLEAMHFENKMQRAIQKSRLEKRYLYDASIQKRVYGLLFESLDEGVVKELDFYDKELKSSISLLLLRYRNDLEESEGGYTFAKRILGDLSLSIKRLHLKESGDRHLDANRSAAVWEGLRRVTPSEVPMIRKSDLDYFLRKSAIFRDESESDVLFSLKNSALDADRLLCVAKMEFDEPKRSKNRTELKFRIENAGSILDDSAKADIRNSDLALLEFRTSVKIAHQNLRRYKEELKRDPLFKRSAEALCDHISAIASFYRKKSANPGLRTFVDSMDRSTKSFLRGESDAISFRLENRSGLTLKALAGAFLSRMMQKNIKESYPNQNVIEFLFDNFSIEFGNDY